MKILQDTWNGLFFIFVIVGFIAAFFGSLTAMMWGLYYYPVPTIISGLLIGAYVIGRGTSD